MSLTAEQALVLQRATEQALVRAVDASAISIIEVGLAARLAATVRHGDSLTMEQARQAWRILSRNEEALARAGIDLPGGRVAAPVPAATPEPATPQRPTLSLRADGRIGVGHHPFALKEPLKVDAHAQWDTQGSARYSTTGRQQWHTAATPAHAAALALILGSHDPLISERVRLLVDEFADRERIRAALDPSGPVPEIDFSTLLDMRSGTPYEHQYRAVDFATASSASLLAVPMGGGKTAAAIAAVNRCALRTGKPQRVVIVCPNKVRGVWPHEVSKWSKSHWHMVDGKRPPMRKGARPQDLPVAGRLEQAESCLFDCACGATVHAAVFNYEMLGLAPLASGRGSSGWVPPVMLDCVIYDEVHRLKSPTGAISKTAARWVDLFSRRIGLSGTPMPQYPWDIFGVYRALDPGIFGPLWNPFRVEYIQEAERKDDGKRFPVGIRKGHREEFARRVHSIMYRPTIDLKLPGATHVVRRVELEPKAMALYERLERESLAELAEFTRSVADRERADDDPYLTPKNILARRTRLRQLTGGTIPDDGETQVMPTGRMKVVRDQYRVSYAKAEELEQTLEEIGCVPGRMGGPEPVVVYCAFLPDLDAVAEVAEKRGLRYAEISGRRSDGLNARSQLAEKVDVCGVQVESGGTGVDLTRSCWGVWYSPTYSAGSFDQALKRQDRPGQTRRVTYVYLVAQATVDEDVYRARATRQSETALYLTARGFSPKLIGEGEVSAEDAALSMDEVANLFNARRAAEGTAEDGIRSGGVPLPLDEFAADVFGDPRPREPERAVDPDELAEFGLEGFA